MVCLVVQSVWLLWTKGCSPPGSSVHEDSPGKNTGVGCHALLQGIFPAQGSNPGLPHGRRMDSLPSEPPGKPKNTAVGSRSLLQWIFSTQESNWGLQHCRWILYQLSYGGISRRIYYRNSITDLSKRKQICGTPWNILKYTGTPLLTSNDTTYKWLTSSSPPFFHVKNMGNNSIYLIILFCELSEILQVKWLVHVCTELLESCSTLCDPMECSPPVSSARGIFQARTLEWVAIHSSRGSSQLRDQTQVSRIAGRFFTVWATREAQLWCIYK